MEGAEGFGKAVLGGHCSGVWMGKMDTIFLGVAGMDGVSKDEESNV